MPVINLPTREGRTQAYRLRGPRSWGGNGTRTFDRIALAAAHVVADPLADVDPWLTPAIDWEATIAYRRYLWGLGLGVAEAMDTAQRGAGLDWPNALELIRRSVEAAREVPGAVVFSGVNTDQLALSSAPTIDDVIRAYEEQIAAVEAVGGRIVLMSSRALAATATSPDDYARVYGRILAQVREPVIVHWLGDMFDPALKGYWGSADHLAAMDVCIGIVTEHAAKVDGIKLSLLDKDKEIRLRRRLPQGVRTYTGDDFNFAELIAGDAQGFSDALLGIFDVIAPAASAALDAHGRGDLDRYWRIFEPTVPLSRHIFKAPTRFYKTGVVFLAYLNGHQSHFVMVGGQQSARSLLHLIEAFRLADTAGLIRDPDLAVARLTDVMRTHGLAV
ncbi:MAG TPA: dihydrodipicolinate synthase family protein [Hyphomicrobiaceae bacterium]|jgi:hypothetical protein